MKNDINHLKNCGNVLEKLLDSETNINILRVYGYESRCGNTYYSNKVEYMNDENEAQLLEVFNLIWKKVRELDWNDNKIVVEIYVASWHLFIGYYDDYRTIGGSVIPNENEPKKKVSEFGCIERIKVR